MRFAEYPRKCCGFLGFRSNQNSLNVQILLGFLLLWSNAFLTYMSVFWEANTPLEYACSLYTSSTTTVMATLFTIFFIERSEIFDLFDTLEEIFQNSE